MTTLALGFAADGLHVGSAGSVAVNCDELHATLSIKLPTGVPSTLTHNLQVSVEQVPGRYKVFRHLPASPAMQFTPASSSAGANSGSSKGGSSAVQLQVLAATGESAVMFLAPDLDSTSGAACGMMAMNGEAAWERLQTAEDYQAFLARQFPSLPPEWLPEVRSWNATKHFRSGAVLCRARAVHRPLQHATKQPPVCYPASADGVPAAAWAACCGRHACARLAAARPERVLHWRCRSWGEHSTAMVGCCIECACPAGTVSKL